MVTDDELKVGLDYVFSFFEKRWRHQIGKYDRDVRLPTVFSKIAFRHSIFPPPSRSVIVTGSKGKGTCARLIAHHLQNAGHRVGLVLTPEELTHMDRIRLNGEPIAAHIFLDFLERLKPDIDSCSESENPNFYFPPTAIFLLVALVYFADANVDYVVIEGGRGAKHDEIGQIPAAVAIVTSVLPEHLAKLGPTVSEICLDKFSVIDTCSSVICSPQAYLQAQFFKLQMGKVKMVSPAHKIHHAGTFPAWLDIANSLAMRAVFELGVVTESKLIDASLSASCQILDAGCSRGIAKNEIVFLDGAVTPECLDIAYMRSRQCAPNAIVIGLTGDKNVTALLQFLKSNGFNTFHYFRPVSLLGYTTNPSLDVNWAGTFDMENGLDNTSLQAFSTLLRTYERIYVIGVQVFLRAIRHALDVKFLSGRKNAA